ncbi:OPT family small oligopeptide transporter [Spizellomyces punctatus DAOM BR117]|uniref:OPT family small oligopeptide transporter n=1 Tax=Spizellomyces punctatus (strain DAOM BR117) TaxID=645134 RepID=A0A0L0H800_SPIPD|nr:OPT family small oligopeptide transporter [Spizellomyces punctatus DAOM BR117]KNC97645.1 OPT family small oligopeptide transporter [Spizellomyces punctatus DAOM BR117]|eukprot:XP_016605685.1 OPT family small oligopeptide transporter [Spizellomyces punctatus DAOM BR117]
MRDSKEFEKDKTLFPPSLREDVLPGLDKKEKYDKDYEDDVFVEEDDVDKAINAVVPTTDDPSAPTFSFRVMVLGTLWCVLLGGANSILAFRTNPFGVTSTVATLLSFPMGKFLARVLPDKSVTVYKWTFSLNPGPFSQKEHVLISIIAGAGAAGAYGLDNVVTQKAELFMGNQSINIWESFAWILASQFIGFGLAGIMRRFVVWPKQMMWPSTLSLIALFVSFHGSEKEKRLSKSSRWRMSRFTFFLVAFAGAFAYTWLPEYLMVVLQTVSVLCLITTNKKARFLGSSDNGGGIGIGALSFDWTYIGGGFLTAPFWATLNYIGSNWLWTWVLTPIVFYSNAFGMDQQLTTGARDQDNMTLPVLNSVSLFDNTGNIVSPLKLYNKTTFDLDETAYQQLGPVRITSLFALNYGSSFMAVAATVSHVVLWYGRDIWRQIKEIMNRSGRQETDIHNELMKAYPEVPEIVYLGILVVMTIAMILVAQFSAFEMPIWAVLLAIGLAGIMILPIGVILAITGTQMFLNVLTEFVIGLMIPGKTVAVMAFKSLGTNTAIQAMSLLGDLKLGHYMKIAPRAMLAAQFYGTFVGAIVSTIATFFVMSSMEIGKGDWQALSYRTFYSAGAIWGAIGPQRFFGIGAIYGPLLWCFLIGLLLPILPWLGNKIHPSRRWMYINIPLIAYFSGAGGLQNHYIMPLIAAFIFQYYLFRHANDWWKKYNYVLAVALDSGAAVCILVITVLTNMQLNAPVWAWNPDIRGGVQFDYYCTDGSFTAPPAEK